MLTLIYQLVICWLLTVQLTTAVSIRSDSSDDNASPLNNAFSPPFYPTPFGRRIASSDWESAFKKAEAFVSQLTLAEKVNLTSGTGWMMGRCVGNTGDIPRFNFSGLCLQDGPLGVRSTDFNTAFPAGITTGSTFNKQLIYNRGKAIGLEHKYKGVDVALGPVAGPIGLKGAGGRIWEGFGADPYLSGVACGNTVRGIQDQGVIANAKHFIGNEQEHFRQISEWTGYGFDLKRVISSNIDDRALHEVYGWPFGDMVRAGVGSVMCSYNQVNNSLACQNSYLLNNILKEKLGFPGFVVSDWGALNSGVASALSGADMNMPGGGIVSGPEGGSYWSSNLSLSVLNGSVPTWRIDDMAVRIMAAYFKVNRDEARAEVGGPNFSSFTTDDVGLIYLGSGVGPVGVVNEHVNVKIPFSSTIAEQVAVEGIVLLKNVDDTLPLKLNSTVEREELHDSDQDLLRAPRKIGILGAAAGPHSNGPNCQSDMACTTGGVMASGWGSGSVRFPFVFTPFERINQRAIAQGVLVDYDFEDQTQTNNWDDFDRIVRTSDVNIVVGSAWSGEGYLTVHANRGDRNDFALWYGANEQIKRAASLSENVIVVLNSVGPVNMEQWIDHPNVTAVIFSGPQGEFAGEATAQILFGETNPSGRLPFTIAKDDKDYIPIINVIKPEDNGAPQDNFDSGIYLDYKYYDSRNITPRYEFGYGLSFSNWKFSDLTVHLAGAQPPSEDLPPPPALGALPEYNQAIPSPEELLFPPGLTRIPDFLYPYIGDVSEVNTTGYTYPDGYSAQHAASASLPGGSPGGNPILWDVAYQVKATIHNDGPYGGAYVPQLYLGFPENAQFPSPPRQLRGFEKISLEPGEYTTVNFDLLVRDLSVWDTAAQSWVVQRGTYKVYVGSSSRNLELETTFNI